MTVAMQPRLRRSPLRLLIDHNPFFLLSAGCMLAGIFALNNAMGIRPKQIGKILILLGTLNLYESLLIALGLFLILVRGVRRDGRILLLIEAMFLVDITFLNHEVFMASAGWGLCINALTLLLAAAKIGVMARLLKWSYSALTYAFIILQLAAILALPGVLKNLADHRGGQLPAMAIYAAWWVAALLPALYAIGRRPARSVLAAGAEVEFTSEAAPRHDLLLEDALAPVFLITPFLSLLLHLCLANWVYKVTFHPANLSPLLLAAAVWVGRSRIGRTAPWRIVNLPLALPAAAALLSLSFPEALLIGHNPYWALSPLRLALVGAMLTYVDGFILHRQVVYLYGGVMALIGVCLGPTTAAISGNVVGMETKSVSGARRLVPHGSGEWGAVAIAASFVLLGIGALVSLFKSKAVTAEQEVNEGM